jgi:DNA repair protein RecN (Recombination protein N)
MLTHLTIRNYAIIDTLELEFSAGLTALTGETGAGKSILLGALGLVLGDRADSDSIRQNSEHAEIIAEFDGGNTADALAWLQLHELDQQRECILRRRISKDGRSRAYINGTPVNVQQLRQLGEMLIDIHGQHEHQSLMKTGAQRRLLDDYADHQPQLDKVGKLFRELKQTELLLQQLQQDNSDRNNRLDLLRFQTQELDALGLADDEYAELNEQHARLANAERLASSVNLAIETLYDNDEINALSLLSHQLDALAEIAEIDNTLQPVVDLLGEAQVQIEEAVSSLRAYADDIDLDAGHLATLEQRIQDILDLARKHRVAPEQLPQVHRQLAQELDDFAHADDRLEALRATFTTLQQSYNESCTALSTSRQLAAKDLNTKITRAMQTLGMKGGRFVAVVTSDSKALSANGYDRIEFTVSTNAGQACKSLAKFASGGELARISLAIQMITASRGRIPTLIFDEVDSGVGGGIAEIVGQQLRALGTSNQVLCITHLAQVASQAHQHLRVQKQSEKKHTQTQVSPLDPSERIREIARMLSGVEITEQSLAHAEDMITRAQTG